MSFSTYWQHINIHTQAYTHIHTPTLNTGSVIQSVKSDVCGGWLRGGWGVQQTGRRLRCRWPWRQQPCAPERSEKGAIQWKGPCPIVPAERRVLQPLGPPFAQTSPHPAAGWRNKSGWRQHVRIVVQRRLSSSSTRQLPPPPHTKP